MSHFSGGLAISFLLDSSVYQLTIKRMKKLCPLTSEIYIIMHA